MKKAFLVLVALALFLAACESSPYAASFTGTAAYEYVPAGTPAPAHRTSGGDIEIRPFAEGEWVVITGWGGDLDPVGIRMGAGDKCFALLLSGPTSEKYELTVAGSSIVSKASWNALIDDPEENLTIAVQNLRNPEFCPGGVDVWRLPPPSE